MNVFYFFKVRRAGGGAEANGRSARFARCAAIGLRPAARSPDFEKIKHIHWPKGLSLLLAPFFNNPKIVSSRVAFFFYAGKQIRLLRRRRARRDRDSRRLQRLISPFRRWATSSPRWWTENRASFPTETQN